MELINREESKLSQLFYLDNIPANELVKVDNPGGGECLYTSIINFLRLEFIVKKELYKKDKRNEQRKKFFLPYMVGAQSKITHNSETLLNDGRKLRRMVCDWLSINRYNDFEGMGVSIQDYLIVEQSDDPFLNQFLTKNDKKLPNNIQYDKYLAHMEKPSSYGGPLEVYALGKIFKRSIRVYSSKTMLNSDVVYKDNGAGYNIDNDRPIIAVYHTKSKDHFKTIYPKIINGLEIRGMNYK